MRDASEYVSDIKYAFWYRQRIPFSVKKRSTWQECPFSKHPVSERWNKTATKASCYPRMASMYLKGTRNQPPWTRQNNAPYSLGICIPPRVHRLKYQ